MVAHRVVDCDKIVSGPEDVFMKVCEFLEYRFPGRRKTVGGPSVEDEVVSGGERETRKGDDLVRPSCMEFH